MTESQIPVGNNGPGMLRNVLVWIIPALCVLPVLILFLLSFGGLSGNGRAESDGITLSFWTLGLTEGRGLAMVMLRSALISSTVAIIATVCGLVTGRMIALSRHRRMLLILAYLPFAISPVILGATLLHLYLQISLAGTTAGVVAAQLSMAVGFAAVLFDSFWSYRIVALENEARLLGCSPLNAIRLAVLPLAKPVLLLCLAQTFLISWFQYGMTLLIGTGRVQTLPPPRL